MLLRLRPEAAWAQPGLCERQPSRLRRDAIHSGQPGLLGSPDLFVVPRGTVVDVNAVSTETTVTPGFNTMFMCGCITILAAQPLRASRPWSIWPILRRFPSSGIPSRATTDVGNNISATGVSVPAGGQALIGPLTFTAPATGIGSGHKCLLAAIEADGQPAPANSTDAPNSNQVGQRNLQFVSPCVFQTHQRNVLQW